MSAVSNNLVTGISVPVDKEYAPRLGIALYAFAYLESTVIQIIEVLSPGFRQHYYREAVLTSGRVAGKLREVIDSAKTDFSKVSKDEMEKLYVQFSHLVLIRNPLIHAHPSTDENGNHRLTYQGQIKPAVEGKLPTISDWSWSTENVNSFINAADAFAVEASLIFDRIRTDLAPAA